MRCDHVRRERDAADAGPGGFTAWRVRRHLRRCAGCAAAAEATGRLEEDLQSFLGDTPPAALRSRVAEAVSAAIAQQADRSAPLSCPDRSRRRLGEGRTMRRRILLGVAGVGACLLAAAGMWDHSAYAQLERLENAVSDVQSAHEVAWRVRPDGSRTRDSETWYQAGHWRIEGTDVGRPVVQIYTDGRLYSYDAKADRVTYWRALGPFGYNPSGFSIKSMVGDYSRWGWKDRIERLGGGTLDGRPVQRVRLTFAHEPGRVEFAVDPQTDLPIGATIEHEQGERWIPDRVVEFTYNQPVPARLFEPRLISKTATFFDRDDGQRLWGERLAKGIALQRAGDRVIVLRDVQVNEAGDVFLLYTAGNKPGLPSNVSEADAAGKPSNLGWRVRVTDDLGTRYAPHRGMDFIPVLDRQHPSLPNGYLFDGEKLEGAWLIPVEPPKGRKPRSLTITFYLQPYIIHGEPPLEGAKRRVQFALPVDPPTAPILPEWMPYMAIAPQEWEVAFDRARDRAFYHRMQGDLVKAAEGLQEALRLSRYDNNASLLCDLGEELAVLGRREEAREAFEKALNQPGANDSDLRERIQRGLDRMP